MSKYIDADALRNKIQVEANALDITDDEQTDGFWHGLIWTRQALDDMPAADVEPAREWIPCSESLPEDRKCVLICYESGGEDIGWRSHGDWWVGYSMDCKRKSVVAWHPLPEAFKTDGGSEE